ncbi:hypothetical protein [Saccharopolyspora taberi]
MKISAALVALALFFSGPAAVAVPTAASTVAAPTWSPQINDVKEKLKTECDQAWFWSGTVDGQSVQPYAERLASEKHGFTLAAKLAEQHIPEPDPNDHEKWREYSQYFAEGAKCSARTVLGDTVRPDSVWYNTEFPALKKNVEIDSVWQVAPKTGAEWEIWHRSWAHNYRTTHVTQ